MAVFVVGCGAGPGVGSSSSSSSSSGASGGTGDPDGGAAAVDGGSSSSSSSSGGSSSGSSSSSGGAAFWTDAYNPAGSPAPVSGKHNAGRDCMDCHDALGTRTWLFGGTVYTATGSPAAHVQVGLRDATQFLSTYSASNGNFWITRGTTSVDWTTAVVRLRTSAGEKAMSGEATAACNNCHVGTSRLVAP